MRLGKVFMGDFGMKSGVGVFRDWVLEGLACVRDGGAELVLSAVPEGVPRGRNEYLLLLKPELMLASRFDEALDFILERVVSAGFSLGQARIFSGGYLGRHAIMAAHYGVINRLCRDAGLNLSVVARAKFEGLFGVSVDEGGVLGAFEYLDLHPGMSAGALLELWLSHSYSKLAGGAYVVRLADRTPVEYLVNGFHPEQLAHFTAEGRAMLAVPLFGDMSWKVARGEFLGATDPASAREGSVRRVLHERREVWGADLMRGGMNGVHLSAGPLEALVELRRFGSDQGAGAGECACTDFLFGRQLAAHFSPERIGWMMGNPDVVVDGKKMSLFDLTEEQEPDEAVAILKRVL